MATALESLPNVGTVAVSRTGPDGRLGYTWFITFVENPGYFPAGSGDVHLLEADCSGLVGDGASCFAEEVTAGSPELSGAFVLKFSGSVGNAAVTRYTDELPFNSLPEEVGYRACEEIAKPTGEKSVTRISLLPAGSDPGISRYISVPD